MPVTRPTDRIKAKALANIGSGYLAVGPPYDEAMRYYEDALKADRTLYTVHYNIAIIHIKLKDFRKALESLCAYKTYHDGDVVRALEQDDDGHFKPLIDELTSPVLRQRISGCGGSGN